MSTETPGTRLKIATAGLHQLATRGENLAGGLSATAAPSLTAASSWQASAGVVSGACAQSHRDLATLTRRMRDSAARYIEAGAGYSVTDVAGALRFRELTA